MIKFPDINPVLIPIGPLAISWYSLSYVVGILIGLKYCKQLVVLLNRKQAQVTREQVTKEHLDYFVNWSIIGIITGGRLGYVLFYDPAKYFAHPIQILKTYEGGMSFHGGLIGYCLAALFFARKWQISFLALIDLSAMAAPIPICLARIANFINGELYGRITSVSWAVIFPNSDLEPRHPSQIYEAILEGLILFLLLLFIGIKWQFLQKRGTITSLFLIFYSLMRIFVECFREPDSQIGFLLGSFTMGQILSSLMLGAGIGLAVFITRNNLPAQCP